MRAVFFIFYISLFFCKNVGAIHNSYAQELQHGHFSLPKNNQNTRYAHLKAEQTFDYGLVEDLEESNEIDLVEDLNITNDHFNFNWLAHYLAGLLQQFQTQDDQDVSSHFAVAIPLPVDQPIYVLQQVFKI